MAVAITEEPVVSLASLQPLWHDTAPRQLVERCPAGDPFTGWKAWQEHLLARKRPALPRFVKKKDSPLLWGWPAEWERDALQAAIESPTSLAEAAIGEDANSPPDLPLALQLVALAYAMPRLARELPAETWWFLVERLHTTATQAGSQRVDWETNPRDAVRSQLLAGELPLALGCLFPEVRALRELRDEARAALSEAIVEITDGQGLPHARLLPVLGPLFACWTRARWFGAHMKRGAWSQAAELQYEWLVRHAIRLADGDDRFLLSSPSTGGTSGTRGGASCDGSHWSGPLFATALKLAGDRSDHAAAAVALPRGVVKKRQKPRRGDLPQPSLNSDWACVTVMADGWSQSAARLAVSYADNPLSIELAVDGERVLAGSWTFHTTCNGQPVQADGEWEQLCWETGKRFDFLELGLTLTEGLRLERQLLFGREDRVLYYADIIFPTDGAKRQLQHSVGLPLADGARWNAETETRDGIITGRKLRAAVMPLALHEWRSDPRGGSLFERDGQLTLTQQANGRALCCPLLIDLDRKRSATERTWRQLTVGETMEIVPADVAVGYRAQSGDDQWLMYRSLGQAGNRTVLGHNVAGEFCGGRFLSTGKFKQWIEIEAV